MSEIILKAENLKKYYEERQGIFSRKRTVNKALDGVSFEIRKGSILGLAGESGSGKSTAGKTVLSLIKPDGGRLWFEGRQVFDAEKGERLDRASMTELRSKMQIIFQDPSSSLNPKKNVEQIISAGIIKHGNCPRYAVRENCIEIMEKCGLDRRQMMRYPHEFSGGQKQRIGIARALAVKPSFVVCDEPTAALDMSIQSQILNLMLDMKEQYGLTYLFISHNLGVAEHFCDELAVMYRGKIVERAETRELFSRPAHPYTKLLLDSVPRSHPNESRHPIEKQETGEKVPEYGCRFAPRCPYREKRCLEEEPDLRLCGNGHWAACWKV